MYDGSICETGIISYRRWDLTLARVLITCLSPFLPIFSHISPVVLPSKTFDAAKTLAAMTSQHATVLVATPAQVTALSAALAEDAAKPPSKRQFDLSALRAGLVSEWRHADRGGVMCGEYSCSFGKAHPLLSSFSTLLLSPSLPCSDRERRPQGHRQALIKRAELKHTVDLLRPTSRCSCVHVLRGTCMQCTW